MLFDSLFEECTNDVKNIVPPTNLLDKKLDNMLINIEAEFTGAETAETSRNKEIKELKEKISATEKKLKNIKNPSNLASMSPKTRGLINKKLSKDRTNLRNEIQRYKIRLDEIETETDGLNTQENDNAIDLLGIKKDNKPKVEKMKERMKDKLVETIEKENEEKKNDPNNKILSSLWKDTNPYTI